VPDLLRGNRAPVLSHPSNDDRMQCQVWVHRGPQAANCRVALYGETVRVGRSEELIEALPVDGRTLP
jgi:hypothetical protein